VHEECQIYRTPTSWPNVEIRLAADKETTENGISNRESYAFLYRSTIVHLVLHAVDGSGEAPLTNRVI
jgi:hypothetical protein